MTVENTLSFNLCLCGCGQQVKQTFAHGHAIRLRDQKGEKNPMFNTRGEKSPFWKGGRKLSLGYVLIYKPKHPYADVKGYVKEHRLIMEEYLGRYLTRKEVIHHINGIRNDNRLENLMLFKNHAEHMSFELKGNQRNKKDLTNRLCVSCGSKHTYHNKKGRPVWHIHKNNFICSICFGKTRKR